MCSSQDRVAAVVPIINWSTICHRVPRFGLYRISFARAYEITSRTAAFGILEGEDERSCPWRTAPPSRPALPRPAAPTTPRPWDVRALELERINRSS